MHTSHFVKVMSLDTFMTFFHEKNIPSHSRKRTFVLVGHMSLFPMNMYVPNWVEFSSQLPILTYNRGNSVQDTSLEKDSFLAGP